MNEAKSIHASTPAISAISFPMQKELPSNTLLCVRDTTESQGFSVQTFFKCKAHPFRPTPVR